MLCTQPAWLHAAAMDLLTARPHALHQGKDGRNCQRSKQGGSNAWENKINHCHPQNPQMQPFKVSTASGVSLPNFQAMLEVWIPTHTQRSAHNCDGRGEGEEAWVISSVKMYRGNQSLKSSGPTDREPGQLCLSLVYEHHCHGTAEQRN